MPTVKRAKDTMLWKTINKTVFLFERNNTMELAGDLTNLQHEFIKVFSFNLPEVQLLEIKDLLARYFADIASDEMDKLWDENGWTNETMDNWSKEHKQTKYE